MLQAGTILFRHFTFKDAPKENMAGPLIMVNPDFIMIFFIPANNQSGLFTILLWVEGNADGSLAHHICLTPACKSGIFSGIK